MKKTAKISFLAKSSQLKVVMFCLWLFALVHIFKDAPRPLDFFDIGGRVILGLCAALPFVVYFLSGKYVTIDFVKKTVRQGFVLMKIPIGPPKRSILVCEVFLLPEILTFMSEYKTKEIAYNICVGKFVKAAEKKPPEETSAGYKRAGGRASSRKMFSSSANRARRAGAAASYFALKHDVTNFKKAETLARSLAKKLEVPARIYWEELKTGLALESKTGSGLETPFKEPDSIKNIEEDFEEPCVKALKKRRKKNGAPQSRPKKTAKIREAPDF